MSEKDKKTIIIAAIVLLIFGIIMLGIKPGITNLKEAKAQNAELSATKQEMQTEIEALPTYKTQLDAAIADYNATGARVFNCQTNDKIHDEVVKMVQDNGLSLTSLNITNISPMGFSNYIVDENGATGGQSDGTVNVAYVSASVSGPTQQVIAFVDYLNKTEGTLLQTVTFSEAGDQTTVTIPYYIVVADSYQK